MEDRLELRNAIQPEAVAQRDCELCEVCDLCDAFGPRAARVPSFGLGCADRSARYRGCGDCPAPSPGSEWHPAMCPGTLLACLTETLMRWIRVVLPLAALSLTGAAPVPKHLMPKDEPFWPTSVGTKWVYTQDQHDSVEEITRSEKIDGKTRLTISKGKDERTFDIYPDKVVEHKFNEAVLARVLLRFPLKPHESWENARPEHPGLICLGGKMTVGDEEEITVPAGIFHARKVSWVDGELAKAPITSAFTLWYARGVGLVRIEWKDGGRELKSFTPGKK